MLDKRRSFFLSELIANRKHRQELLKGIIRDIHAGADVEEVKDRFADLLSQVGPGEIGEIEQALINEGLPVEEIQRLCDVHVAVFRESLDKKLEAAVAPEPAADPLHDLKESNRRISALVDEIRSVVEKIPASADSGELQAQVELWAGKHQELLAVDKHYSKKENILFPYLERYGISGPPTVMWGKHDEIRAALKEVSQVIERAREGAAAPQLAAEIANIVLPTLNDVQRWPTRKRTSCSRSAWKPSPRTSGGKSLPGSGILWPKSIRAERSQADGRAVRRTQSNWTWEC
jgi:DUF438 domain-containing protein